MNSYSHDLENTWTKFNPFKGRDNGTFIIVNVCRVIGDEEMDELEQETIHKKKFWISMMKFY